MQNGGMIGELLSWRHLLITCRLVVIVHSPFTYRVGENRFGLAQILKVKYRNVNCDITNDVATGPKHVTDRGGKDWDVNSKLAAGKPHITFFF